MTDFIKLSGTEYPIREIHLNEYEVTVLVSNEALQAEVFDENGGYTSREAQLISELVFFYVPDELLEADDAALEEYIYDHLDW